MLARSHGSPKNFLLLSKRYVDRRHRRGGPTSPNGQNSFARRASGRSKAFSLPVLTRRLNRHCRARPVNPSSLQKIFCEEGWTTRNRVYPISGILSAQVGLNPNCVVKSGGDVAALTSASPVEGRQHAHQNRGDVDRGP